MALRSVLCLAQAFVLSFAVRPRNVSTSSYITRKLPVGARFSSAVLLSSSNFVTMQEFRPNSSKSIKRNVNAMISKSAWANFLIGLRRNFLVLVQLFPTCEEAPYNESLPGVCGKLISCSRTRFGIGHRANVSSWVCISVAPILMASLIVFCTSMKPRTSGKLDIHPLGAFAALLVTLVFAMVVGNFCYDVSDQNLSGTYSILVASLALTISIIISFWMIDIDFDWPAFPWSAYLESVSCLYCASLLLGIVPAILIKACLAAYCSTGVGNLILAQVVSNSWKLWTCFIAALVPRNTACLFLYCYDFKLYTVSFYLWEDTTGSALATVWTADWPQQFARLVFVLLCFVTPYSRDRYFVAALGGLIIIAIGIGMNQNIISKLKNMDLGHLPLETWFNLTLLVVASFACCVAIRFQITLPEELQKIKYLRLGYLQERRREGQQITRCQNLPESAFGNPAKVAHMIIISHHWLDGHTCDTATLEYPCGLRFTTMCQRLEQFFPSAWPGFAMFSQHPLSALSKALKSANFSNNDCLVFFDFMCLPQIGMRPDGSLIERTAEENALFKVVLPACGLLYTMFPVMVCPEVKEGVIPYLSSGWCFCEWEQATLCGTLSPYSVDPEDHGKMDSMVSSTTYGEAKHSELLESILAQLEQKQFRSEGDRDYVRGIFRGTWVRRALVAAVRDQDVEKVEDLIKQLAVHNLQNTISFPVDSLTLDSLLHVAKKLPSEEIQRLLTSNGADPERPNHRGERPGQWLIFPRSWLPCSRCL